MKAAYQRDENTETVVRFCHPQKNMCFFLGALVTWENTSATVAFPSLPKRMVRPLPSISSTFLAQTMQQPGEDFIISPNTSYSLLMKDILVLSLLRCVIFQHAKIFKTFVEFPNEISLPPRKHPPWKPATSPSDPSPGVQLFQHQHIHPAIRSADGVYIVTSS